MHTFYKEEFKRVREWVIKEMIFMCQIVFCSLILMFLVPYFLKYTKYFL
jgi:hypothetical protein